MPAATSDDASYAASDRASTRRPSALDARAADAEHTVTELFGRRLARMPFTHLGRTAHPTPPTLGGLRGPWHYWWQAHYLDAIVDAGLRQLRDGDLVGATDRAEAGDRLLRTVRLRNAFRWTNDYYDDMAWLALASGRLAALHDAVGRTGGRRRLRTAERALTAQLRSAMTPDLGGGLYWSTTRDFKNVPASGPAALHLARIGDTDAARRIVDWLYSRLWSPETGLFLDGIRVVDGDERVVPDVWSYNQGTVLGALVTLGDGTSLTRAANLVAAVDDRLVQDWHGTRVLRTHGGGDGGLFTGILVRYLALAATTGALDSRARATAVRLVRDTADAFWWGRGPMVPGSAQSAVWVFSPDPATRVPAGPASRTPVELSTQLQAWTVIEASAGL